MNCYLQRRPFKQIYLLRLKFLYYLMQKFMFEYFTYVIIFKLLRVKLFDVLQYSIEIITVYDWNVLELFPRISLHTLDAVLDNISILSIDIWIVLVLYLEKFSHCNERLLSNSFNIFKSYFFKWLQGIETFLFYFEVQFAFIILPMLLID